MSAIAKTRTPPAPSELPAPPLRTHRFTVEQYERMAEVGILKDGERIELIEGWIVDKMTQHPPHAVAVDRAREALQSILSADWRLREQKPIRLADSEPEPDLVIVPGPITRFGRQHPRSKDIALLIEVADSSLSEDRNWKNRVYARAQVVEYWIINLVESQVEVYTQPKGGKTPAYRERRDYGKKDSVPVIIDGKEIGRIKVNDLLP